ncbi:MAG: hypothetical protein C4K58_02025 [Flavobacteriaceae bacterium]|nr:MAG: hypothetical protein C4K58_02025 [Flavobacteriaceae bacterium]
MKKPSNLIKKSSRMLHYRKIEEPKTDLIILHGLLGMSDNWGVLGKRYAQTYRVHLLDLPNHGQSPHQKNMSFESMAQDIIQYMDSENIKKCLIIGHSLGGKVAITLSFLYPERFHKVIVVDICQRAYQPSMLGLLNLLHSTDLKKFEDRSDIHQYLLEKLEDRELVGFVGKNIERQKDNTFKWKANLDVILENYPKMVLLAFKPYFCTEKILLI